MYGDVQEEESSIDVSSPRDNNSPIVSLMNLFRYADKHCLITSHPIHLLNPF